MKTTWRYAGDAAKEELGPEPLSRFDSAGIVKSNAVREVRHIPGFYLKIDRRPGRSFAGEVKNFQLLRKYGFPAVEHLAWGTGREGACLVTREPEGFCDLSRCQECFADEAFLIAFAGFLKRFLAAPLFHPDFHIGNLLYNKASREFLFVDLHGIRKRTMFDRLFRMDRLCRLALEIREPIGNKRLLELLRQSGIPSPETFYFRGMEREAAALFHEFPRRAGQILSAYPKFTRRDETGALLIKECTPEELAEGTQSTTSAKEASQLFLFHFFLELAHIPHRRVLKLEESKGTVTLEKMPEFPEVPEEYTKSQIERLRFYRLEIPAGLFRQGRIFDLPGALKKNLSILQKYLEA